MADTTARVNMITANNGTWQDAFIFGTAGDTTWSFSGQNFRMDIKGNYADEDALLSLTTGDSTIIVDDVVQRILHLNVPEATITGALVPGRYFYDLVMYDGSTPPIRIPLMHGEVRITQGITGG